MQPNDTLAYIDDFNMEPLLTSQLQLPDMDALRVRGQRMSSPPTHLHNLMPPPAPQPGDQHGDLLRLLPDQHHQHQHLGGMKYPGTPPDTPPSSSPTSPYHHLGVITSSATTIGIDVSELVWRGYQVTNNQDQVSSDKQQTNDPP